MLGMGTVGGGVVRVLEENAALIEERLGVPLKVKRVAVKSKDKPRDAKLCEIGEGTNEIQRMVIAKHLGL